MQASECAFISYAGAGHEWARWIANEIEALGIEVIIDVSAWHAGQKLQQRINEALEKATLFVALINGEYFDKERWSADEYPAAYAMARSHTIFILPYSTVAEPDVPPLYRDRMFQRIDILTERAARQQLRLDLGKQVNQDLRTMPLPAIELPYPGLILKGRPRYVPDPEVDSLIDASQTSAESFIRNDKNAPDPWEIDSWQRNALDLSRQYAYEPPQNILDLALTRMNEIRAGIAHTDSPSILKELHKAHSLYCGLLSYASLDLGKAQAAYVMSLASQRSARLAQDADLQAWGIGTQAMILRFDREFKKSVEVVNAGLSMTISGSGLARLHAQNSLGQSEMHDEKGALESIRQAEEAFNAATHHEVNEVGIFLFPQAKLHYYAGTAYLGLGKEYARRATEESSKAIIRFAGADLNEESVSDGLLAQVHLALGHLGLLDLESVLESLQPLFSAPLTHRTAWHFKWLSRLVDYLEAQPKLRTSDVVQDIGLKFEEYKLTSPNIG